MLHLLQNEEKVYIFGAGSRAKTMKGYLSVLYPKLLIAGYLFDNEEENESEIDGVPVLDFRQENAGEVQYPVLIATKGIYHKKISDVLQEKGFTKVIPVTVQLDNWCRNVYVSKVYTDMGKSFVKLDSLPSCVDMACKTDCDKQGNMSACIYVAKSIYDRELESAYQSPLYEKTIQVGAALTEHRLEKDGLTDDIGDNISARNRQYCELTGLYWIWKYAKEDVIGLAHYRRHFILEKDWMRKFAAQDVDVILPVPTYVYPSIDVNYRERHIPDDWDYLLQYLQKEDASIYNKAKEVFGGSLYLPCNMLIAKKEVLDDLCSWMFPILDAVAEHGGVKEDTYMNRYVGFISERLITLFFTIYEEKYHIVYADRMFLR